MNEAHRLSRTVATVAAALAVALCATGWSHWNVRNLQDDPSLIFPLTVGTVGTGGGTVKPASGGYQNGVRVDIAAFPDSGSFFAGWIGTGPGSYTGTEAMRTIMMAGPITQTAQFLLPYPVDLTMIAGPGGTVTPGSGTYLVNSQVTITATPDSGNGFRRWTGQGIGAYLGTSASATITLGSDVTQTALFLYDVPVTITTSIPGLRIGGDGVDYTSPHTFLWRNTSQHTVDVDSLLPGAAGYRDRFTQWSDGVTRASRVITVPDTGMTLTAVYVPEVFLDFVDPPEGTGSPGDSWQAPGAVVSIEGVPHPGYAFASWTGQGNGSYTGTNNPASVTMNEPLVQTSSYDPYGYEFSISASATDPYVNTRPPTGGLSNVYLWMTCTDVGIAAMEADVSSTVPYVSFVPAPGVLNAGGMTNLLLAFTGCPGIGAPYLVGTLSIEDTGGEVCLAPSAANGRMGAVNCEMAQFIVDPVRVTGFSSSAEPPCYVPGTPCLAPPVARSPSASGGEPVVAAEERTFVDSFAGPRPNPFAGQTTLRFSSTGAGAVRLGIYDVTGRLVRRIVDGTLAAGEYDVTWDGRAADGSRVPAGVYFARLESGGVERTRKVVLLGRGR